MGDPAPAQITGARQPNKRGHTPFIAGVAMLSLCCRAPIHYQWGHMLCSRCTANLDEEVSVRAKRDIIDWCFPPEKDPRPSAADEIFVRYGKKVEVLKAGGVRGRPDGWSWSGA